MHTYSYAKRPFLFLIFFLLYTLSSLAQNGTEYGKEINIKSKILGEKRKIWVHLPEGYKKKAENRYPVVYVLDGHIHFGSTVSAIEQMSFFNGNIRLPQMIVVGILNTDRTRDLTPTKMEVGQMEFLDSAMAVASGGGQNFVKFLKEELFPWVEKEYNTAPHRTLIGHSFGGLMAIECFQNHNDLFNNYLVLDASMWWDDQLLLKQIQQEPTVPSSKQNLFLAIANTSVNDLDSLDIRTDTTFFNLHLRKLFALHDELSSLNLPTLDYTGSYYPTDDHNSLPHRAIYDGLLKLFDYYSLPYTLDMFTDTSVSFVNHLRSHYDKVSKEMGYRVIPSSEFLLNMALQLYYFAPKSKVENVLKYHMDLYPKRKSSYLAYVEYYKLEGDTQMQKQTIADYKAMKKGK